MVQRVSVNYKVGDQIIDQHTHCIIISSEIQSICRTKNGYKGNKTEKEAEYLTMDEKKRPEMKCSAFFVSQHIICLN